MGSQNKSNHQDQQISKHIASNRSIAAKKIKIILYETKRSIKTKKYL